MSVVFLDPAPLNNEGFDISAQYQMLPSGGVRRMGLFVQPDEPEDVIVFSSDPGKATLFGLSGITGRSANRGSGFFVGRNSAIRFFLSGGRSGPTTLAVESVTGKPRGFLLVSVKQRVERTYNLYVLSDIKHVPDKKKAGEDMKEIMKSVERAYLDQANIKLTQVGAINDVVVPADLGDPIKIDQEPTLKAVIAAAQATKPAGADLHLFHTWDVEYSNGPKILGSTAFNCCFLDGIAPGPIATSLYSHEIGHALGLSHSDQPFHTMFPVIGGNQFTTFEIEKINLT